MSGPMKLNRTITTMITSPAIASLFWANVRATSTHGLPLAATSPPSRTTSTSPTAGPSVSRAAPSVAAGPPPFGSRVAPPLRCSPSPPASVRSVPDPRIENRITDVSHEVAHHRDHADQHCDAEHHLVVVAQGGLEVLEPGPRVVEDLLDDQRP